ncbi:hypothetical protein [Streptomyces sp. NPDC097619]|uniref:Rv1733c family protein n=1 Tax=Streptomyces sp. NPDC097619 TaxID=3157228 RepID=UPI00331DED21
MRAATGVWRWRRNPLCRRTDRAEAWAALLALLCLLLVAPAVGWTAGARVDAALREAVREQRAHRYEVTAVVLRPAAPGPLSAAADPQAQRQSVPYPRVIADWTGPDGSAHRGALRAPGERPRAGERFTVWTDSRGRPAGRPLDPAAATGHAVVAGFAAALGVAALAETLRRLVVRRLVHRRYERLDRAWAAAGPDWGRAGAGS